MKPSPRTSPRDLPTAAVSPARAIAARVLERVYRDEAFASAVLDAELTRHPQLDGRDRALATELVYGVLRTEGALAARIATIAPKKGWSTDPRVRAHVLIGAYTIAFLDRIPAFAAVSEATSGAREAAGPRVGGFANALLRKLSEAPRNLSLEEAVVASAPGWLRGALRKTLGRAGAAAYLSAGPVPPPNRSRRPSRARSRRVGRTPPRRRARRRDRARPGVAARDPRPRRGSARGPPRRERSLDHAGGGRAARRPRGGSAARRARARRVRRTRQQELAPRRGRRVERHARGGRRPSGQARRASPRPNRRGGLCDPRRRLDRRRRRRPDRLRPRARRAPCTGIGTLRRRPKSPRNAAPNRSPSSPSSSARSCEAPRPAPDRRPRRLRRLQRPRRRERRRGRRPPRAVAQSRARGRALRRANRRQSRPRRRVAPAAPERARPDGYFIASFVRIR